MVVVVLVCDAPGRVYSVGLAKILDRWLANPE
jgi:hypothetical protein